MSSPTSENAPDVSFKTSLYEILYPNGLPTSSISSENPDDDINLDDTDKCLALVQAHPAASIQHLRDTFQSAEVLEDPGYSFFDQFVVVGAWCTLVRQVAQSSAPETEFVAVCAALADLIKIYQELICSVLSEDELPELTTINLMISSLLRLWDAVGLEEMRDALSSSTSDMCDVLWRTRNSTVTWTKVDDFHALLVNATGWNHHRKAAQPTFIPHIALLCWYRQPTALRRHDLFSITAGYYFTWISTSTSTSLAADLISSTIKDLSLMGSHAFFKRVNTSLGDPTLRADSPDRDICRSFLVSVVGEQGIVENWVLLLAFPRVLAVLKGDDGPGPTEEERDARVCCGWIGCEYYCSPNPAGKLLRCSRCNDARYCDRKCQVRDWKEGGHKKLCGKKG